MGESWIKKEYLVIFLIILTEIFGFSLILPFLPFYAESYGASPLVVALIFTAFSFFQFFSAPVMGKLSDHYGRKPLLVLSQLSTCLGFIVLGFANSLWMIILSRIIDGLLGSNMVIAQAYLSDVSPLKDRSKVFGLTGVAFGIGFLIGPAIGGSLAMISYSIPAFLAAGMALVSVFLTIFVLKETITEVKPIEINAELFAWRAIGKYLRIPELSGQLWVYTMFILTHVIFVTNFALYAERQLHYNASHVGFILGYVGLISIFMRGFLLPRLIDWVGEPRLATWGIRGVFLGMFMLPFVSSTLGFMLSMTFFAFGTGVLRPILKGELSRSVSQREQGALMGVAGSLESVSQIIGPIMGGFMINYFIPGSLGILAAAVIGIGAILLYREHRAFPEKYLGV